MLDQYAGCEFSTRGEKTSPLDPIERDAAKDDSTERIESSSTRSSRALSKVKRIQQMGVTTEDDRLGWSVDSERERFGRNDHLEDPTAEEILDQDSVASIQSGVMYSHSSSKSCNEIAGQIQPVQRVDLLVEFDLRDSLPDEAELFTRIVWIEGVGSFVISLSSTIVILVLLLSAHRFGRLGSRLGQLLILEGFGDACLVSRRLGSPRFLARLEIRKNSLTRLLARQSIEAVRGRENLSSVS